MKLRPTATALTLLLACGAVLPAAAQPAFPSAPPEAGPPPPPPPGPPERFVLEPGHWQWRPRLARYVWVHRHWIATQPGYANFVPGHWRGGLWIGPHWAP